MNKTILLMKAAEDPAKTDKSLFVDATSSHEQPVAEHTPLVHPNKKVKKKKNKLMMNVASTQYSIVKKVAKKLFHFKLSYSPSSDWDILWADYGITSEALSKMKSFQKTNHFPAMHCLARKENLAKNLMKMRKLFPKDYSFIPTTWCIPRDYGDLKADFAKGKCRTYIVKPEASCQGKGIYLIRSLDELDPNEHYVVQNYIKDPYLIDGLKFDIRLYVLVYGCDPLRIFIHRRGLVRLATEQYEAPNRSNMENVYMHLTNYAINKNSENFVFNTDSENADVGHKRSLEFVWKYIDSHGGNSETVQRRARRCIVKSLCAVQPHLAHSYRMCQPSDIENNMCFEVLGYDIMLDSSLRPWLLEVNHAPSFETDTPFDHKVKSELIADTLKILHMDYNNRVKYNQLKQDEYNAKVLGKAVTKLSKEAREELRKQAMEVRDKYEAKNLGNYVRIYPDVKMDSKYEEFIAEANKAWNEFYGFNKRIQGQKNENALSPVRPSAKKLLAVKNSQRKSANPLAKARAISKLACICTNSFVERRVQITPIVNIDDPLNFLGAKCYKPVSSSPCIMA
eukprot:TRINITY_DN1274_c0_g2_i1.p1 TRINITY_DN1274_c0_g2~~TRINITY_DN1274_c0_g2_i1.p1  ORF type:complete len:566 (-),score=128.68 TRINITY_DN1274_c0_g2_i1:285-1982(-)